MFYLWQLSTDTDPSWAAGRLESILSNQLTHANQLFARQDTPSICSLGSKILVGWAGKFPSRFIQHSGRETFLIYGVVEGLSLKEKAVIDFFSLVERDPKVLKNYSGKFLLAYFSEDSKDGFLASSVSECLSLWTAEGKNGSVYGWRPGPTLDLSGVTRKIDLQTAELYLSLGWQASHRSHYLGCRRFPSRTLARLHSEKKPSESRYIKLGELFSADEKPLNNEDCADFLTERVKTQLANSSKPLLFLSGGRDSRMIAAAAVRAGYQGAFTTAEKDNLIDAQIAQAVAKKLDRKIEIISGLKNRANLISPNLNRILDWTRLNESLEALRHTVRYPQITGQAQSTEYREIFHGFGGEHMRGFVYNHDPFFKKYPLRLARRRFLELVASAPLSEENRYFDESMQEWLDEFEGVEISGYQFVDIVYWQNRTLFWAEDGNSVKFLFSQRWNPLLDYRLMKAVWNRSHLYKAASRFSYDVTKILAPQLSAVPYDEKLGALGFARRKAKLVLRNSPLFHHVRGLRSRIRAAKTVNHKAEQHLVWQELFKTDYNKLWPQLISEAQLDRIIDKDGDSEVLWHLSALELFYHCCMERPESFNEDTSSNLAARMN